MAIIYVDSNKYEVNEKYNLLQNCLSLNLDIPYFCWHPILGSIGACRLCAVKKYINAQDKHGFLVMSCMTPTLEKNFISIEDKEAKKFRKRIIELLMTNHPHDCPVCEEGGHCHLQDMLVMTGHYFRRYRFSKRTYYNQYLGPFISHNMNRCIVCYRCVRFYKDYADGQDLGVYGVHNNIYFGRIQDGILENEFSGNLIEICPTGVFTDKTHSEYYSRKWDMQYAPSICHNCSLGCNISAAERYGKIIKIDNRYHSSINHYFICDRGRFGYGYVNLTNRPQFPIENSNGKEIKSNYNQILTKVVMVLRQAKKIIGVGSARASIESNFALRELVGEENFFMAMSSSEQKRLKLMINILYESGIYTPTLREIENYDAILVLGEDITQTNARIALAIRQAVKGKSRQIAREQNLSEWHSAAIINIAQQQTKQYPLFITHIDQTRLDDIATWSYYASTEDQARLGFAIAHVLDNSAPKVKDLDPKIINKVNMIAEALVNAKNPLIISGNGAGSDEVIKAAVNVAKALKNRGIDNNVGITLLPAEVNSIGLGLLSLKARPLEVALEELEKKIADTIIILENDLYRIFPKRKIDTILNCTSNIIVIDHQKTETLKKANFILSSTTFTESNGTVINNEVRAQRFFKVYEPSYYDTNIKIQESWKWLHLLKCKLICSDVFWHNFDDVINACIAVFPNLINIKDAAPDANFRILGQKLVRQPQRYSGRTSIHANINVHESRIPIDRDSMFCFSMEGTNSPLAKRQHIPFAWMPGWNSPQAWNKFQSKIGESLRYGDPGIRLIKKIEKDISWFTNIPDSFVRQKGIWRIVAYYHLFGSEEMSQRSSVIQQCMPSAYVMVSAKDAEILKVKEGMITKFNIRNEIFYLSVRISNKLSAGLIGLPLGFPGIPLSFNGINVNLNE
ncbi:MAG: NADH-quinone oxidoreductase subunit NuoG [Candidatus Dasytiphilus stammeri]